MCQEDRNEIYFEKLHQRLEAKREDSYINVMAIKGEKKEEDYLYFTYKAKKKSILKVRL